MLTALLATAGCDGAGGLCSCPGWEPVRELCAGDRVNPVAFVHGRHLGMTV